MRASGVFVRSHIGQVLQCAVRGNGENARRRLPLRTSWLPGPGALEYRGPRRVSIEQRPLIACERDSATICGN